MAILQTPNSQAEPGHELPETSPKPRVPTDLDCGENPALQTTEYALQVHAISCVREGDYTDCAAA